MPSSGEKSSRRDRSAGRTEQQVGGSRLGILEELADFCVAAGEYTTAADYYGQMIDLVRRLQNGAGGAVGEVYRKMAACMRASGDYDRALSYLQEAQQILEGANDPVGLAAVLSEKAWIAVRQGNYDQAEGDSLRALELAGDADRERVAANALNCLGTVCLRRSEWDRAREIYEAVLMIYRRLGDEDRVGRCYNNLGLVAKNQGHWDQALRYQNAALSISRQMGNELASAGQLNNLGITLFKCGEWTEAYRAWEEARGILERLGEKWEITFVEANLGNYHRRLRHWVEAEGHYRRALETSERNGDVRGRALALEFLATLAGDRHETDRALELYQEGLAVARGVAPRGDLVIEMLRGIAETATTTGDWTLASRHAHEALALAVAAQEPLEEGCLHRILARVDVAGGRTEAAREHFDRSIHCLEQVGEKFELAGSLVERAALCADSCEPSDAARADLERAREIYRSLGVEYELGQALLAEARLLARQGSGRQAREALDEGCAILARAGWPAPESTVLEIHAAIDQCLASAAISEANDLASFVRLSAEINSIADPEARLQRILETIGARVGAQRGRLVIEAPDAGRVFLDLAWEDSPSEVAVSSRFARGVLHLAAEGAVPLVSTRPAEDARLSGLSAQRKIEALLAVPLWVEGKEVGGVYVDRCRRPASFAQGDVDLAVALVNLAAASYREIEAEAQLREMGGNGNGNLSPFPFIITRNPRMLSILETVSKLRNSTVTVLLSGETGTGKELVAQAIHGSSDRPLVIINCAAMAEGLLESELYGHVRGAFTDAYRDKEGLFGRAAGGTVFLDEIDKTSRNFQERLLRVVDKHQFRPVGSSDFRETEFRIICATNQDLSEEVEAGRFLKDLYYRLKVVDLHLPPLRERREDIPLLARHFLALHSRRVGRRGIRLSAAALDLLASYPWPGNVRALEHELERVVAFSSDGATVEPADLSPELQGAGPASSPAEAGNLEREVETLERRLVTEALRRFHGNRSRAARSLGISRRGLLNKIGRYGLS